MNMKTKKAVKKPAKGAKANNVPATNKKNLKNSNKNEDKQIIPKVSNNKKAIVKAKNVPKKGVQKKETEAVTKVVQNKREVILPATRMSDQTALGPDGESVNDKFKWINKQRVMIVASRGITYRDRHLMNNLKAMMPHSKSEPKMDTKDPNDSLNEMCEIRNCNKVLFFENRRRKDLYLWASNTPSGPSMKFLVENGKFFINF